MVEKPSETEEQWFKDQELKNAKEAEQRAAHLAALAAEAAIKAERGRCPRDGAALATQIHEGVEIDQCPTCKGVWLDAGELEHLEHGKSGGLFGFLRGR
ncbi:MAG: hypothetical protein JWM80_5721 [Cyanobacteria bacterium RYN_339]|nr:hypothetical protein [Cyanobacteria bacterium RYN_339]